jgi:cysteine desulfurase family protein (TIGR01976 family)
MRRIDDIRGLFPALRSDTVYLDNAGGSQAPASVSDRMHAYLRNTYVQLGADYDVSTACSAVVDEAHHWIARMMNAGGVGQVALGASTSVLCAFLAEAYARRGPGGRDEIVVCDAGHEANIGPWMRLAERGYRVRVWKIDPQSLACHLDDLRALLNGRTRLVAFHHISNLLGEVMDVGRIAKTVHECGARVVVDGVAYAPHRPIDVAGWGVDWYVFSLYKTFGPHMAALYGSHAAFEEIEGPNHFFVDPADRVYKFELGGVCHEGCAGILGVRDYFMQLAGAGPEDGLARAFDQIIRLEQPLQERLLAYLTACRDVRVIGPLAAGPARVPTISFTHARISSREIAQRANRRRLGIRFGHFYAHRLCTALGLDPEDGVVRASMVHYNTLEEVDRLIDFLDRIL